MYKIEADVQSFTVRELYDMYKKGQLVLDIDFQRGDLWANSKRTGYIHSALLGILIISPAFLFSRHVSTREGGTSVSEFRTLDGKQRLTTLFDFIENKFALSSLAGEESISYSVYRDEAPVILDSSEEGGLLFTVEYDAENHLATYTLAGDKTKGLYFKDLDVFQELFLNTKAQCTMILNPTKEQEHMYFDRVNDGVKMSTLDRTRVYCEATHRIRKLAEENQDFFKIMFKEAKLKQKPEDPIIIKTKLMLETAKAKNFAEVSLSSKFYKKYAASLAEDVDLDDVAYIFSRALEIYSEMPDEEDFGKPKEFFITTTPIFLALAPFLAENYSNEQLIDVIKIIGTTEPKVFKLTGSAHSPNGDVIAARQKYITKLLRG